MIHVIFQEADRQVLQKAFELDETLAGEIIEIRDEFAVGPITGLETEEGWNNRQNWWRDLITNTPYQSDIRVGDFDDRVTVEQLKAKLNENPDETAWLWVGQNQHDVCGYYWLVSQLKDLQGRIAVLFINNLPFINEKGGLFYPKAIHEISPREIVKAKKLSRKLSPSEFEMDPEEWSRLVSENATVRTLEGGKKILGKEESFYDKDILNGLTAEWQKGNRAMHSIYSKMKITTGDVFLLWRIRLLADEGKIDIAGEPAKGWKEFELRLKSQSQIELNTDA